MPSRRAMFFSLASLKSCASTSRSRAQRRLRAEQAAHQQQLALERGAAEQEETQQIPLALAEGPLAVPAVEHQVRLAVRRGGEGAVQPVVDALVRQRLAHDPATPPHRVVQQLVPQQAARAAGVADDGAGVGLDLPRLQGAGQCARHLLPLVAAVQVLRRADAPAGHRVPRRRALAVGRHPGGVAGADVARQPRQAMAQRRVALRRRRLGQLPPQGGQQAHVRVPEHARWFHGAPLLPVRVGGGGTVRSGRRRPVRSAVARPTQSFQGGAQWEP